MNIFQDQVSLNLNSKKFNFIFLHTLYWKFHYKQVSQDMYKSGVTIAKHNCNAHLQRTIAICKAQLQSTICKALLQSTICKAQ